YGHTLRKVLVTLRSRCEMSPHAPHAAIAFGYCLKDFFEIATPRPPELVRVGIDHPVCTELGRGTAGHRRHPLRLIQVALVAADLNVSLTCVAFENLRRPVVGAVVDRDHEVDAG